MTLELDESFYGWLDFDGHSPNDDPPGPARRVEVAGRCVRCWGPIHGSRTPDDQWTHIECRLCRHSVNGEEAEQEAKAMLLEMDDNLTPARIGQPPEYREAARFVLKIMPEMVRSSPQQIAKRKRAISATKKRRYWINRHDVPAGHAGFLYLQARVISFGVESLPTAMATVEPTDFGEAQITGADVSATGDLLRVRGKIPHREPTPEEQWARMGRAMVSGMAAAFACEVGMKAILLTRKDEASRTHDLRKLHNKLPADSRVRLEADYRGLGDALKRHRHTFDKWRYLERSAGQDGFRALVDSTRAMELRKATRVILDECATSGLTAQVEIDSTFDVSDRGGALSSSLTVQLEATAGEAEVPWQDVLTYKEADGG